MSDQTATDNDDPELDSKPKRPRKEPEDPLVRRLRLEKEGEELKASVASGDISALKNRVAAVLNLYPHTRNSDVSLSLKYWETFQHDVYSPLGIAPTDLFKLERVPNIVRVRQKIQNEYGLFVADEGVRKRRKRREDDLKGAVIEDAPSRKILSVFADETGKTDNFLIVAAVWVLTGRALYGVERAIEKWQKTSPWKNRELHFKDFRRSDLAELPSYLDVISSNREFISFKIISVEQSRTRRSVTELVQRLHEYMLIRGAQHELSNKRIELPYEVNVVIDKEQSLDEIALAEIRARVSESYKQACGEALTLDDIKTAASHHSQMIQLADVIAGAVNRRRNYKGERNYKDDMADMIIDRLELVVDVGDEAIESDAAAFLQI